MSIPFLPTQLKLVKPSFRSSLVGTWDTTILNLIRLSDKNIVLHKICALPPSHSWSTELKGVTLIGDAAHVMSPFAGEGVNLALMDAYELGRELVSALRNGGLMEQVDKGLRLFKKAMWQRRQMSL